jgi:glycosyltransferase involved in cell wall biosynthesis
MRFLFTVYRDIKHPHAVGGDIYLWELARGLAKRGHQVCVISSAFKGASSKEIIADVEVVRIKNSITLPFSVFKTYRHQAQKGIDAVIEEAIGGQRLPFFGALYVKQPLIAVWHQRNQKVFKQQYSPIIALPLSLFEYFLATLYRKKTIVTPSLTAKNTLLPLGFKSTRVKVVYDGVDETFHDITTFDKRENIIVCLGKLRRYKRFDQAIIGFSKALPHLKSSCKLVIAGKVSEIEKNHIQNLKQLTKKLNIENRVDFRINLTEEEKFELLRKSKMLLQPSPVEGFSIVIIEANRCGTPVVASDGVPTDVVRNGVNGFVYPFGDTDLLAQNIVKFFDDNRLWQNLSTSSLNWSTQFSWENSVSTFIKVISDLQNNSLSND